MQAYRVETTIQKDGSVTLQDLPFQTGDSIEVIILARTVQPESEERYSLRGTPVKYTNPFEPVALEDWAAVQ